MKLSDLNKTLEGQKELKTILSRLLIYAKSLTRHSQQAEDLTHKTLVKALERESTFDGKNLMAWLRTILLNSFKDELRKKRPDNFTNGYVRVSISNLFDSRSSSLIALLVIFGYTHEEAI